MTEGGGERSKGAANKASEGKERPPQEPQPKQQQQPKQPDRPPLLTRLFKLRPGELGPTLTMFTMFFCIVGAFIIGRAVRDTLFLAALPASKLAPLYVAQSFALGVVSSIYAVVAQRIRRDRLIVITPAILGISVLGARALIGSGNWILYVLYLWIEIIGTISILEFWTFANELYNSRDAKRLFGLIAAGSTVATILVGLVVSGLAPRIGASNLLFLCAGLLVFAAVLGSVAAKRLVVASTAKDGASGGSPHSLRRITAAEQRRKLHEDRRGVIRTPHALGIALVVLTTTLVVTLIDFQFKAIAGQTFGTDKAKLASYFGTFYSLCGVISFIVQLAITGRLLDRFGVVGTLGVLPLLLIGGSAALLIHPLLWAVTLAKGFDHTLRYTLNDAGMQLLYMPLPADIRARAKAFVEGVVKPGAQVVAGAGVLFVGASAAAGAGSMATLSIAAIALTGLWIASLVRLRGTYIGALRETLRTRRARLVAHDDARALASYAPVVERELRRAAAAMVRAKDSSKTRRTPPPSLIADEDIEHAIELALSLQTDLLHAVIPLLDHPHAPVRKLACEYAAHRVQLTPRALDTISATYTGKSFDEKQRKRTERIQNLIEARLDDRDADVRAAAIAAYCTLRGASGLPRVKSLLDRMRTDTDPAEREHAAIALGVPAPEFAALILPLLKDTNIDVRKAAAASAAKIGTPELIAPLVQALGDKTIARDAGSALARYGSGIESALEAVLSDPKRPAAREHVPRILGKLGTPRAIEMLTETIESKDDEVLRRAGCYAFARAAKRAEAAAKVPPADDPSNPSNTTAAPTAPFAFEHDPARLTKVCTDEIATAYRAIAAAEAIEPTVRLTHHRASQLPNVGDAGAAAAMLVTALMEKREGAQDRVFFLLQVLFPRSEADGIREGTKDRDPTRRANALEILDSTLDGPIREQLLPLLDESSQRSEKIAAGARFFDLPRADLPDEWIMTLLDDENAWVAACAAHYAGVNMMDATVPRLREIVASEDAAPILRESALVALGHLSPVDASSLAQRVIDSAVAAATASSLPTHANSFPPLERQAKRILMETSTSS